MSFSPSEAIDRPPTTDESKIRAKTVHGAWGDVYAGAGELYQKAPVASGTTLTIADR